MTPGTKNIGIFLQKLFENGKNISGMTSQFSFHCKQISNCQGLSEIRNETVNSAKIKQGRRNSQMDEFLFTD